MTADLSTISSLSTYAVTLRPEPCGRCTAAEIAGNPVPSIATIY